MKQLTILLTALLTTLFPAPATAQGVTPRTTDTIVSSIKMQEEKREKNLKLIELHEQCLECSTCACKVITKNGTRQHQHTAKLKNGRKILKVKNVGLMNTKSHGNASMKAKVHAAIDKIKEENATINEEIEKLKRRLEALGGSYDDF